MVTSKTPALPYWSSCYHHVRRSSFQTVPTSVTLFELIQKNRGDTTGLVMVVLFFGLSITEAADRKLEFLWPFTFQLSKYT